MVGHRRETGVVLRAVAAVLTALAVGAPTAAAADASQLELGRDLYDRDCAQCHGPDGRGVGPEGSFEGTVPVGARGSAVLPTVGPSLRGAGARSAHFYLTTGYMPIKEPYEQPERSKPNYTEDEIDALVAYVDTLGGGPDVPEVDLAEGDIAEGFRAYTEYCAGCHQTATEGGVVLGGTAPPLNLSTPEQIVAAIRIGPYVMPAFGEGTIDDETAVSIARYVVAMREPEDRGGWGIGHLGAFPEGIVAWVVAGVVLVGLARALGERAR